MEARVVVHNREATTGVDMRKTMTFFLGLALAAAPAALGAVPANVASAVSAPGRSADNVKLDESRKPAALLKFFGLQQGMQVVDMFGGNRYWAEIIAPAVGPSGRVTVWEPTQFYGPNSKKAFEAFAAKDAQRFDRRVAVRGSDASAKRL